ncbi:leucyl aminopeptidase [bacterium]|nr:leucyl aminopeptidase [bacterium]
MSVKVVDYNAVKKSTNCVLGVYDVLNVKGLPVAVQKEVTQINKTGDLKGKKEGLHVLYPACKEMDRLLLYYIGKRNQVTLDKIRKACARIVKKAVQLKIKTLTFDLESFIPPEADASETAMTLSLISHLALYKNTEFKPEHKQTGKTRLEIVLACRKPAVCLAAAKKGEKVAAAINVTRCLADRPANKLFPQGLASEAKKIAGKYAKMTCNVLQKKALEKKGFGALLAVGAGSPHPPVLIELNYRGGKPGRQPIALVGKGVTFDSGGISLKPSAKMDEMRYDMSGAATVLGIFQAAAELKLPVNLLGVIPAAENMPSGTAVRPGDIVKSLSGKTIEILNTDAEGRVILADALTYAKRYNPETIIDFATLTGAVIVALGHVASGLVTNNERLAKALEKASVKSGEKLWQLPLWDEYKDLIKSENADIANMGNKSGAGTIVGAAFLEAFVGTTPWAHLDIAGTAWGVGGPVFGKGATGVGVRLILDWLQK